MLVAVRDWDVFVNEVPWFLRPGETQDVGVERPWQGGPVPGMPELSSLLDAATVTPVGLAGDAYELLAWGPPDSRRGWLALPPVGRISADVHESNRHFWDVCGGIVERFGEPLTWWNNQDQVLSLSATQTPFAPVLRDYAWLWKDDGRDIPIHAGDFYVVAIEANGNLTVAHRASGRLLLFAPDHAYEGVTPLAGCPPYSLLTIDDIPDLRTWIESCASAWRDA